MFSSLSFVIEDEVIDHIDVVVLYIYIYIYILYLHSSTLSLMICFDILIFPGVDIRIDRVIELFGIQEKDQ